MLETFNAPAFDTAVQAVLSLYVSDRTTGIVLDASAGDDVLHIPLTYVGYCLPHVALRLDLAGKRFNRIFSKILSDDDIHLRQH